MTPDIEHAAQTAYLAHCTRCGAFPRPWTGPGALPEHRKEPWRAVAKALDKLSTNTRPVARAVMVTSQPVRTESLMERWQARSKREMSAD